MGATLGPFPRYRSIGSPKTRPTRSERPRIVGGTRRREGPMPGDTIDQLTIDTIRTRSMDAVEQAKSGRPGTPVALAPVAFTLWRDFLRYDPDDPLWPDRDRFVLSNGHASMLLYSLLYLAQVRAVNSDYEPTEEY